MGAWSLDCASPTTSDRFSTDQKSPSRVACSRKTLIFVRHGQSEYNLALQETGRDPLIRDAPLSARGREQARAAKEVLSRLRADFEAKVPSGRARWLLAVSPLRRALDTASEVWPGASFGAGVGEQDGRGGGPANARFEVLAGLREVMCSCADLGSTPAVLLRCYPHLERQLSALPQVWWTVPPQLSALPPEGEAMRESYASCPDAWEAAEEAALDERLVDLVEVRLAEAPEELVVIVAHCNLIRCLTRKLGLTEQGDGWVLKNCECRAAEGVELRTVAERAHCR